jgi:hypothetical protein
VIPALPLAAFDSGVYIPMGKEKPQIEKFREAMREFGVADDHAFEEVVAKVAKAPKISDDEIKRLAKEYREQSRREEGQ